MRNLHKKEEDRNNEKYIVGAPAENGAHTAYRRARATRRAGILLFFFTLILTFFTGFGLLRFSDGNFDSGAPDRTAAIIQARADSASTVAELNAAISASSTSNPQTFVLPEDITTSTYISIPNGKSLILDLNGHTIDRGLLAPTTNGFVFYITGKLVIRDSSGNNSGKITGGYDTQSGSVGNAGALYLVSGSNVVLEGGTISENRCTLSSSSGRYPAGAVYAHGGSTFSMTGGVIKNNEATGNYAVGGVFVDQSAGSTFDFLGGTIENNEATGTNSHGGLLIWNNITINMGGSARVVNNRMRVSASDEFVIHNVYHQNVPLWKANITIPFTSEARIGITPTQAHAVTAGYSAQNPGKALDEVFFPDDSENWFVGESPDVDPAADTKGEVWIWSKTQQNLNWDEVCRQAVATKRQQIYTLLADWTAQGDTFGITGSYSYGGGLYVPANSEIVLDLNGKTLDRARTSAKKYGSVIGVSPTGHLTVRDSSGNDSGLITGGYDTTDNKASSVDGVTYEPAGGIQVCKGGKLTMEGGTIAGNNATGRWATGGIMLRESNVFVMTGGVIRDNFGNGASSHDFGGTGGVFIDNYGLMTMTGGVVKDNVGNYFGGVVVWRTCDMQIGGSAQVYGNTGVGDDEKNLSYYGDGNYVLPIVSAVTAEFNVGITQPTNDYTFTEYGYVFTEGWDVYNAGKDPADYFFADEPLYGIVEATTEDGKKEAALYSYDNAKNWQDINAASEAENGYANNVVRTYTLYSDWTASANGSYATAFGTSSAYAYGALYCRPKANILFDLNGYTLDRGLGEATSSGTERCVIRIDGKLRLIDSSDERSATGKGTGKITGGYSTNALYGSGLMIYNTAAICTLEGGTITGNVTTNAAAITVHSGSKLNLGGTVQIYGNTNADGVEYNLQLQATSGDKSLIGIVSPLTAVKNGGKKIPVSRSSIGLFTEGFGETHPDEEASHYFLPEDSANYVQELAKCETKEGYLVSRDPSITWEYVVNTSLQTKKPEIFVLEADWTAQTVATYGTTFSVNNSTANTAPYFYGALQVPDGAQVILDLNGHTIDRALTQKPSTVGGAGVIKLYKGNLWIHDSSDYDGNGALDRDPDSSTYGYPLGNYRGGGTGKITGGYGSNAGAIDLDYTSHLYITGGEITGNTGVSYAAAILADNTGAEVTITGGSIHDNNQVGSSSDRRYGGGVYSFYPGKIKLGGRARIYDNYNRGVEENVSFDTSSHGGLNSTVCIEIVSRIIPENTPGHNDGFWVGVTRDTNNYTQPEGNVFTQNLGSYLSSTYRTDQCFFADNPLYVIQQSGRTSYVREATVFSHDNNKNWYDAVVQSTAEKGYANDIVREVKLYSDWTGTVNASYGTVLGYNGSNVGYVYGALFCPASANIRLDLNGYTIDRGLGEAETSGTERCVIRIDGKLRIIDSSDERSATGKGTGKITGGYSTNALYGSALMIFNTSAMCTVVGGTITGNVVTNAAAVTVHSGSKLKLGGTVQIYGNTKADGTENSIEIQAISGEKSVIEIVSPLTAVTAAGGKKIGVRRASNGDFTQNFGIHHPDASATDYFVSENDLYNIIDQETDAGVIEGYFLSTDNGVNWEYAVNTSLKKRDWEIFKLSKDWIAEAHSRYQTSFSPNSGTSEASPYWYGTLMLPTGAKVILDLNGYTIDRKLKDTSHNDSYGLVLRVFGELILIDSSDYDGNDPLFDENWVPQAKNNGKGTGKLIGGRSRNAGGMQLYRGGNVIMYSGTICDNVGINWGGGVIVEGGSSFTMLGGTIRDNEQIGNDSRYSGGVHIYYNTNSFSVGGTAKVYGNVMLGVQNNVSFYTNSETMHVVAPAEKGFHIGVTKTTNNYTATNGAFNGDPSSRAGTPVTDGWSVHNPGVSPAGYPAGVDPDSEGAEMYRYFFADLEPDWDVVDTPVDGATEAGMWCQDNHKNWYDACVYSRTNGVQVYFRMYSDWTAAANASYITAFGYDGSTAIAYCRGELFVSSTTNIVLDLAGYKLDRALTDRGGAEYCVIRVDGVLRIEDSSDEYDSDGSLIKKGTGVIKGGYSTDLRYGSGVMIWRKSASAGSECTIVGGTVTDNKGAPGITVYSLSKLNLGGSVAIYNNINAAGEQSNVELQSEEMKIGIVSQLSTSIKIGVTRLASGVLTEGYGQSGNEVNAETYFESEHPYYGVVNEGTGEDREAALLSYDSATSWEYAIRMSLKYGGQPYVCKLYYDWDAADHSSYKTAFGAGTNSTSGYYYYGSLLVPRGANVILDLNGCKIDRRLVEKDISYSGGYVFYLTGGLQIIDSSAEKNGKIVGGYGTTAGVAYVTGANGSLEVNDVELTGNKGSNGIYVASGSKLSLGGNVKIHDNVTSAGVQANVYFANASDVIGIVSAFGADAKVGITKTTNNFTMPQGTPFTSGWSDKNGNGDGSVKDPAQYFFADHDPDYGVVAYSDADTGNTEAAIWSYNNAKNWQDACERSIATGQMQDFVLYSNWTAGANGSYYTAFGTASSSYIRGSLFVNTNAHIRLDLNGFTLDRALGDRGGVEYAVIRVDGEMEIVDSSDEYGADGVLLTKGTGKITGGYSTANLYGGAMLIYNSSKEAKCTILGGTITGNKGTGVAGVSVSPLSKLCLGGSVRIYDNYLADGVHESNVFLQKDTAVIEIVKKLDCVTEENPLSVYRTANGVFTSGFETYMGADAAAEKLFLSESSEYRVVGETVNGLNEAVFLSNDNAINWLYTVQQSLNDNGNQKTFVLYTDWEAGYNRNYTTAFGTNGTAYYTGALLVPEGASVVLDLNGNRLDRAFANGIVIYVMGTLEITDSTSGAKGVITGGSDGVYVYGGGQCTLEKGTVTGNSHYGINVQDGSFTAHGGAVTDNTGDWNVFVSGSGAIALGGDAYIYGNEGKNLSLASDARIGIDGVPFTNAAKIGFVREGVGPLTMGWGTSNLSDPTQFFYSENEDYIVGREEVDGIDEAVLVSYNNAINWHYAVTTSQKTNTVQKLRLYPAGYDPATQTGNEAVWRAEENANYVTAFGTLSSFINGGLYVPSDAKIVLDMHGVDIDRALENARVSGYVFYVEGELTILDESNGTPAKITGGNNTSAGSAGGIHIGNGGSVILNGPSVSGNRASAASSCGGVFVGGSFTVEQGSVLDNHGFLAGGVLVSNTGTATLKDGEIRSNRADGAGGGGVYTAGAFGFEGGRISENVGMAGGVYIANRGNFTMENGTAINENVGTSAGGVFVYNSALSLFTMKGGEITKNRAGQSGGLYIAGTVEIQGGVVQGNSATGDSADDGGGSGAYVAGTGKLRVTGGEISGNFGKSGVRVFSSGVLELSGTPVIKNNLTAETDGKASNVYFASPNRYIDVTGELASGASVGITRDEAGVFTRGYGNANKAHPNGYFTSDDPRYAVSLTQVSEIDEAAIGTPIPVPKAVASVVYNKQAQTIITGYTVAEYPDGCMTYAVLPEGVSIDDAGNFNAVNAGSYLVTFTPKTGFCWDSDGGDVAGTVMPYTVQAVVEQKSVTVNWQLDGKEYAEFTYDGKSHVPEAELGGIYDGDECNVVSVVVAQTNANADGEKYEAWVFAVDNLNYKAPEKGEDNLCYFVINRAEIPADGLAIAPDSVKFRTPAALSVSGLPVDDLFEITYTVTSVTGSGYISDADGNPDPNGKYLTATKTGSVTVTANISPNTNYKPVQVSMAVTVEKAEMQLGLKNAETVYGDDLLLEATGNVDEWINADGSNGTETGAVTFALKDGSGAIAEIVTVDGRQYLRPKKSGKVTVTITSQSTTNYNGGTAEAEITIAKRPLKFVWDPDSLEFEFDGTEKKPSVLRVEGVGGADGLVNGDTLESLGITVLGGQSVAGVYRDEGDARNAAWIDSLSEDCNYTLEGSEDARCGFEIKKASLSGVIIDRTTDAVYRTDYPILLKNADGTAYRGNGSRTYAVTAGTGTATIGQDGILFPTRVGTVTVTVTIGESDNYESGTVSAEITIKQAKAQLTLADGAYVYGDETDVKALVGGNTDTFGGITETAALTFGIKRIDGSDGAAEFVAGSDGKLRALHVGKIIITVKSAATTNYAETEAEFEIEISPRAVTVEWETPDGKDNPEFVYDGTYHTPAVRSFGNVLEGDTVGELTFALSRLGENGDETDADYAMYAGTYFAAISAFGNPNYMFDGDAVKFVVLPKTVKLVWSADSEYIYNGEEQAPEATVAEESLVKTKQNGDAGDEAFEVTVLGTKNAGRNLKAVAVSLGNPNYTIEGCENAEYLFEILPKAVTIVWSDTELEYTGELQHPVATVSPESLVSGDECTVTNVTGGQVNAGGYREEDGKLVADGSYVAAATALSNPNYTLNYDDAGFPADTQAFYIDKALPELSFTVPNAVYGYDVTLTVSGNPEATDAIFTPSGDNFSNYAELNGNVLTPIDVGKISFVVRVEETQNYREARTVVTLEIKPRPVVLTWSEPQFVYNGAMQTPTATVSNLFRDDASPYVAVTGGTDAGNSIVATATSVASRKYTVVGGENLTTEYSIAPLAVVLDWSDTTLVYNGAEQAPTATVRNLISGDACTVTVSGAKDAGRKITAQATAVGNPNYTLDGGENLTAEFDIDPFTVKLEWSNTELSYTGEEQAPKATVVNLFAGDTCDVIVEGGQTDIGVYTATAAKLTNPNYALGTEDITTEFEIQKAEMTLSLTDENLVYGNQITLDLDGNPENGAATWTLTEGTGTASLSGNRITPTGVGTITLTVSVAETASFRRTEKTFELTISPRPVTLSWNDLSFVYDGAEHIPSATVANLVSGDVCSVTVTGAQVNAGVYTAAVSALGNPNYTLDEGVNVSETFVIEAAEIYPVLKYTTVRYGDNLTLEVEGNVGNGEVTFVILENPENAIISGNILIPQKVGTVKVRVSVAETVNTKAAEFEAVITIEKGVLALEFRDLSAVYGSAFDLDVAGNLENAEVQYTVVNGTGQAVHADGNRYLAKKAGTVQITAKIAASEYYEEATVTVEFKIAQLPVELVWTYPEFTYNGKEQTPVAAVTNAVQWDSEDPSSADQVTVKVSGSRDAGTRLLAEAYWVSNDNYTTDGAINGTTTYTIKPFEVDRVVWEEDRTYEYTGSPIAPKAYIPDELLFEGDDCTVLVTGAQTNIGNYVAIAAGTAGAQKDNYVLVGLLNPTADFEIVVSQLHLSFVETNVLFGTDLVLQLNGNVGNGNVTYTLEPYEGEDAGAAILNGDTLSPVRVGKVKVTATVEETMNTYAGTVTDIFTIQKGELKLELVGTETVYGTDLKLEILGNAEDGGVSYEILGGAEGTDGAASLSEDELYLVPGHVGCVTVVVHVEETESYAAVTKSFVVRITPRAAEFNWTDLEFVYDKTEKRPVATVSNLVGDDSVTVSVKGQIHAGENLIASVLEIGGEDGENYFIKEGEISNETRFTINPRPISIAWEADDFTYNGREQMRTAHTDSSLGLKEGDECGIVVTGARTNAGTYEVTATGTTNPDYTLSDAANLTAEFHIRKADLELSYGKKMTGFGQDLTIELFGNEGNGAVTYTVANETIASIGGENGDTFIPRGIGNVKVKASVAETENYKAGTLEETFTVTKGTPDVKLLTDEAIYGDPLRLAVSGNAGNGAVTYRIVGSENGGKGMLSSEDNALFIPGNIGKVFVEITVAGSEYYEGCVITQTITVKPRPVTTVVWSTAELVYNGAAQSPVATIETVNGDVCKVNVEGSEINAGSYTAQATGLSNPNYELVTNDGCFVQYEIGKMEIEVEIATERVNIGASVTGAELLLRIRDKKTGEEVVAYDNSGTGTPIPGSNYKDIWDGTNNGEDRRISVILTRGTGDATLAGNDRDPLIVPVQIGTVVATVRVPELKNYLPANTMSLIIIEKDKAPVKLAETEVVYGDSIALAVNGVEGDLTGKIVYSVSNGSGAGYISGGKLYGTKAGDVFVTITVAETDRYGANSVTETVTVKPRTIEIEWSDGEFVYNGEEQGPVASVKAGSLLGNDVCDVVVRGAVNAGRHDAEAVGLTNSNYTLGDIPPKHSFNIDKAPLALEFVNKIASVDELLPLEVTGNLGGATVVYTLKRGSNGELVGTGYAEIDVSDPLNPRLNPLMLGTVTVIATVAESENYLAAEKEEVFTIMKPQAPVELKVNSVVYGDTITLEVVNTSEDELGEITCTLKAGAEQFVAVNGDQITGIKKGIAVVVIHVAESLYYRETNKEVEIEVLPRSVKLEWEIPESGFTYDGTEKKPVAKPSADCLVFDDAPFEVGVEGAVNAGTHTANAIWLDNENYTVENGEGLTCEFEIFACKVELEWTLPEEGFTYNGAEQKPEATVKAECLAAGDEVNVTVRGAADAGERVATAVALDNPNYTLIDCETAEQPFEIRAAEVEVEWKDLDLEYNGKVQTPVATVKADGLFAQNGVTDECLVTAISGGARNAGAHTATATGLSNSNYVLAAGGDHSTAYTILAREAEIDWENLALEYTGAEQKPTGRLSNVAENEAGEQDRVALVITGGGSDVGGYYAGLSLAGEDADNYKISVADNTQYFTIVPKQVTVTVTSLNKTAQHTGRPVVLQDPWYSFTANGLSAADAARPIADVFDFSTLAFTATFIDEAGNSLNSAVNSGVYQIVPVYKSGSVTGNDNYTVTIAIDEAYGKLTVTGSDWLQLSEGSRYQFMYEKALGAGGDVLRAAYGESDFVHGTHDVDFDRFVLGQVLPGTSINDFLRNILDADRVRLYNASGELIYDFGTVTEKYAAFADNGNVVPVATGWYVRYGSEVSYDTVYVSVLGDVDGDGLITSADVSMVNSVIVGNVTLESLEFRLAASVSNSGRIGAADASAINAIIIGLARIEEYFTFYTE